jgi:hypothetical protein
LDPSSFDMPNFESVLRMEQVVFGGAIERLGMRCGD